MDEEVEEELRCDVCGREDEILPPPGSEGKIFICEICAIPGMTTLYCEKCKHYTYVPADEYFKSGCGEALKESGAVEKPEDCDCLIVKSINGCASCQKDLTVLSETRELSLFKLK